MTGIGQKVSSWTRWVGDRVVGKSDFRGSDTRSRDLAALGAGAGAAVGATAGVIAGFNAQKSNTITEVWENRDLRVAHLKLSRSPGAKYASTDSAKYSAG